MTSPDSILAELMKGVTLQPLPRLSRVECEDALARLLAEHSTLPAHSPDDDDTADDTLMMAQPTGHLRALLASAPPSGIMPPRVVARPRSAVQLETIPPIDLPLAPSIAPAQLAPPSQLSTDGPPRLVIVSEPPMESMYRLADLEDDAASVGAAISEIIAPLNPPPMPSDSISDAIAAVALQVQDGDDIINLDDASFEVVPDSLEVIDLDDSNIEVVFLDAQRQNRSSKPISEPPVAY